MREPERGNFYTAAVVIKTTAPREKLSENVEKTAELQYNDFVRRIARHEKQPVNIIDLRMKGI